VAVITINIDPEIHLGPLTLAWHGLTIALGILIGAVAAARWLRERGLDVEPMYTFGGLAAFGGIVGSRIFYLFEHDPGGLLAPDRLFSSNGFTFDGGIILAAVLIAGYVHRARLTGRYLDACAAGLPLGIAIGRIGDVILGEHYGERSTFFLAVRNAHPTPIRPTRRSPTRTVACMRCCWPLRSSLSSGRCVIACDGRAIWPGLCSGSSLPAASLSSFYAATARSLRSA